jgi:hypothetical protein
MGQCIFILFLYGWAEFLFSAYGQRINFENGYLHMNSFLGFYRASI